MYEEYFKFSGSPFRLAPDPRFFFGSKSHNKAMAYLHYGLRQAEGFIVITGEIGAGKSVLIGHLLDQLDSGVLAANLVTPNLAPEDLLSHILSAFRVEPAAAGKTAEIEAFEDFLFDKLNHGRRVLLVIDEAQNLPRATLEELRVLSNLNYDGSPLFQVFLVGQPDFRETMARGDMEQLRQRVIASYHLEPMSREETEKYVEHRLGFVGWEGDPKFSNHAYDAIHAATGGLPRRIHKLCNRALLYCAVEKLHQADGDAITAVLADMSAEQTPTVRSEAEPGSGDLDAGAASAIPERASVTKPDAAIVAVAMGAEPPVEENFQMVTAEIVDPGGEKYMSEQASSSDDAPVATIQGLSTSVFDRIRAAKGQAKPRNVSTEAQPVGDADATRSPKSATLDDVAHAILTARSTRTPQEREDTEFLDLSDEATTANLPPTQPPPPVGGEVWKNSVITSINDTREELKRAHDSVTRLRRQFTEIDRKRRKRRVQIAASLDRAESLLDEFQNAWR